MSQLTISFDYPQKQIWAIAGGKGGTGKTFVAASMGILLAKTGSKVIIIDADLGGANLHTCLGIKYPRFTIADFLLKKVALMEDLLIETPINNLKLISGANDFLTIANISYTQKQKLIKHIKALHSDYIILDIGAGTSFNALDLFLISDCGILLVIPEPTSIENVYRFIKCAILRKLAASLNNSEFKDLVKLAAASRENESIKTLYGLFETAAYRDSSVANELEKKISDFSPKLIVNQIRGDDSITLGDSMKDITRKYLSVNLDYLGYIPYDEKVSESIKRFNPFITEYPNCNTSICMNMVLKKLLNSGQQSMNKNTNEKNY